MGSGSAQEERLGSDIPVAPAAGSPLGPSVRLRPPGRDDVDWLAEMLSDPEAVGEHNWAGVERRPSQVRADLRRSLKSDGMITSEDGTLIVELLEEQAPIGYVSWRTEQWGPQEDSRCLAYGVAIVPKFRGKGHGTEAQSQLIDFLFTATAVHRIQSDTALDNQAEQSSLRKIGMVEEGRVRGAEFRNGAYHDHLLFSILRPEWEGRRGIAPVDLLAESGETPNE